MPHLSLEQGLQDIQKHIPNGRVFLNFKKCLQSFGYQSKEDNVAEFFELVVDHPTRFRDTSNFPATWHSNNSFVTGLSSIHRALECPSIRQLFSPARFAAIEKGILDYMRDLKGESAPSDSQPHANSNTQPVFMEAVEAIAAEAKAAEEGEAAEAAEAVEVEEVDAEPKDMDALEETASRSSNPVQDDMFEYLLRLLQISQHTLEERNETVNRLISENKELRKQVQDFEVSQRALQHGDSVAWLQKKLDVCMQYIRDSSDKDPALTHAFMQLLRIMS